MPKNSHENSIKDIGGNHLDLEARMSNQDNAMQSSPPNTFLSIKPNLSEGILSALSAYKFTVMTPVQAAVIPLFLRNKDVCVQAVTGSFLTSSLLNIVFSSSLLLGITSITQGALR